MLLAAVGTAHSCKLRLNEPAAEIIRMLADDTTPEQMQQALCKKYDESAPDEVAELLAGFLAQLKAEGLLIE